MSMPRAIVAGAGIGELAAAIALRRSGYDVVIHEQAPKLLPLGAALSIWPNALAALDLLGCGDALRAVAEPFDRASLRDWQGRKLISFITSDLLSDEPARLPTRAALQSVLCEAAAGIPLILGSRLTHWDQNAEHVSARFDNGPEETADVMIVADGIWSAAATALLGNPPRHAGYGGVLAITSADCAVPDDATATEYWGPGRFGIFAVGRGRYYWFYMRNERDRAESDALKLDDIARAVAGGVCPTGLVIAATDPDALIPFSIHARGIPRRLGQGRIICVGDAAHAMEPNMGQGGCQAIEDAAALGAAASRTRPDGLLKEFERLRLKRVARFMAMSRSGAFIQHRLPPALAALCRNLIRMTPSAVGIGPMARLYRLPEY